MGLGDLELIQARNGTRPWVEALGFRFDPFLHLEASADPYLGEYLVGLEIFAIAWEAAPALVFAPAGGGKTAMRIYVTRACWVGLGGAHPFPIPYSLANHATARQPPTPAEHLHEIVRAGASALLIGLAYRPERFLALTVQDQQMLAMLLSETLPGAMAHYLALLHDTGDPAALAQRLEPSYRLSSPPDLRLLRELCIALSGAQTAMPGGLPLSPEAQFDILIGLLTGPLGFGGVFLLVDGLDAFPETLQNPRTASAWVVWLLGQTAGWAERRIFLKGFLPSEQAQVLATQLPEVLGSIRRAHLEWTSLLLAELIWKRVYVASGGRIGSLDALGGPDLRDAEAQLIGALPAERRLPREALVLVRKVLLDYSGRLDWPDRRLAQEDIDSAIAAYQRF